MNYIVWVTMFLCVFLKITKCKKTGSSAKPNVPRKPEKNEIYYPSSIEREIPRTQMTHSYSNAVTRSNAKVNSTMSNGKTSTKANGDIGKSNAAGLKNEGGRTDQKRSENQGSQKKEKSTTEYLNEKAQKDGRDDALEKRKQDMENRRIYGNIHYAKRLVLGDPVPKGMKLVYCEYCGAENLVPIYEAKEKYNCYFCREKL